MTSKLFGRLALALGAVLLISLFAWEACSDEMNIIQVHRSIPMSDEDAVFRDIYINAGSDAGIKNNLVVQVLRKTIVKDATGATSYGDMMIPVGQLKILFVGTKVSIAREYKSISFDSVPVTDQVGIQVGDKIELKGSYVDNRKPSVPTAEAAKPATVPAVAPPATAAAPALTAPAVAPAVSEAPVPTSTENISAAREPSAEESKEISQTK